MKRLQITILALMCFLFGLAQEPKNQKERFGDKLAFKAEYFGELVLHPGLSVGLDYTITTNNWVTVHWDINLGGYWHRWNNKSAFLKTSIGTRLAIGSAFADLNLGAGYLHSWVAGKVYQRGEGGGIEQARNPGHAHFMPTSSLLFGWDGSKKRKLPMTIYLGPEVYLQSSFNHIFLPHVAAKIGFTYKFRQS